MKLTVRQQAVLTFMRDFFADNDQLPSTAAIARRFNWKSANSAHCYIQILEGKGYIERNVVGGYRFVRDPENVPAAPAGELLMRLPVVNMRERVRAAS